MGFRRAGSFSLIVALFFFSCPSGNIRHFLDEFRPYVDGTYSPALATFQRNPSNPSEIYLAIMFRPAYIGVYHTALYDATGHQLSKQTAVTTIPPVTFSGLALGSTYRITIAPWNAELGREGKALEFVFTHGYSYANPACAGAYEYE